MVANLRAQDDRGVLQRRPVVAGGARQAQGGLGHVGRVGGAQFGAALADQLRELHGAPSGVGSGVLDSSRVSMPPPLRCPRPRGAGAFPPSMPVFWSATPTIP